MCMVPTDEVVIASLAENISLRISGWYGEGAKLGSSGAALKVYPYSFFVEFPVLTRAGDQTLLAKIKRNPETQTLADAIAVERLKKHALEEFGMLQIIQDAFATESMSDCITIEPLAYFEQWNAILMRKVNGKALKDYLLQSKIALRSPGSLHTLEGLVTSSAHWLRVFHSRVSDLQDMPFPTDAVRADLEESFSNLKLYSNGAVNVKRYQIAFENALSELCNITVPVGFVHDDFHYSNVLVTLDNQICAIDNAGNYRACAFVDLATFITDPQTRTIQIMTMGFYIPSHFIRSCKDAVLSTYFCQKTYSKKALDFFCALAVLNKWSEGLTRLSVHRKNGVPLALLKWIEFYFSRLLSAYIN